MNLFRLKLSEFPDEEFVMRWICVSRTTDWYKLLRLPDVSWLQMFAAAGFLVVLVWGIVRLAARLNEKVDPAEADKEMLRVLHELRREGDLTDDEFRSIKGQISSRLNDSWTGVEKQSRSAGNAGRDQNSLEMRLKTAAQSVLQSAEDGRKEKSSASSSSEILTHPTKVPEPSQDNRDLPAGSCSTKTENGQGTKDEDQCPRDTAQNISDDTEQNKC